VRDHRLIDERGLALAQAIADRLRADHSLIAVARANLDRWLQTCSPRARLALLEWQTALDEPVESVVALLTSSDERAVRLRQSNPFAGALPQKVRNEILLRFEARNAATR
jgi:hypothetical protein